MCSSNNKRIVTWGTFDCLHEGHKEFLVNASKLGTLYVIVIPSQVKRINGGHLPFESEFVRKKKLLQFGKNNNIIEDVYIDCYMYGLKSMLLVRPDIICFGYDQSTFWKKILMKFLNYHDIYPTTITLSEYNKGIHSSHYRKGFVNDLIPLS